MTTQTVTPSTVTLMMFLRNSTRFFMEKTFWNHLDGLTFSSLGMAPLKANSMPTCPRLATRATAMTRADERGDDRNSYVERGFAARGAASA